MTLSERYSDLVTPLTLFGKTHPAVLNNLTIESLNGYADRCIKSGFPMLKSVGFEVKRNICKANNNINGKI